MQEKDVKTTEKLHTEETSGQQDKAPEKIPTMRRSVRSQRNAWDIRPYLSVGLTIVLVFAVCVAIFFFVYRFDGFSDGIGKAVHSLQAVWFGIVIAFLINPIMKFFERLMMKRTFGGEKAEKTLRQRKIIRGVSVTGALIVFLLIIFVLLMLIVPQLIISIQELVSTMNEMVATLTSWIDKLSIQSNDGQFSQMIASLINDGSEQLTTWLQEKFLGDGTIVESITSGVYNVVRAVLNFVIGIIVSVYILMTKERFKGQGKKLVYAVFRPRLGNVVMEFIRKADSVFEGFFIGKIIDSIIIGIICFVCLTIMKMPYTMLVSVIIGVTNIIPFFGPFIGAIPSALLIFLVSPIHALYFIIFVFILQQVDGNIIGPKILGDSTGLSPFWVVFAIMLFGGCFGVLGMICGVPIFAMIYYVIKRIVEHILRVRKLPEQTAEYVNLDKVDVEQNVALQQVEEHRDVMLWGIGQNYKKKKSEKKQDKKDTTDTSSK